MKKTWKYAIGLGLVGAGLYGLLRKRTAVAPINSIRIGEPIPGAERFTPYQDRCGKWMASPVDEEESKLAGCL